MSFSEKKLDAVIAALENPGYQWRTVSGVAKEAGVSEATVLEIISLNRDRIVQSSVPSTKGEDLYTTRKHYREFASPIQKIFGAVKNRID